jgi:hypothetical protein
LHACRSTLEDPLAGYITRLVRRGLEEELEEAEAVEAAESSG